MNKKVDRERQKKINKKTKLFAKSLKTNMTPPEELMWAELQESKTGVNFRCQVPIAGTKYVADFLSPELKLIIEVDGKHHSAEQQIKHDQRRDAIIESKGYQILRIPAYAVIHRMRKVRYLVQMTIAECKGEDYFEDKDLIGNRKRNS